MDIIKVKELYQKICTLIGNDEPMQRLNFLFKQQFILATSMTMFLQGVINDFIYILTPRDDETHRMVFQLFLEDLEEQK